MVHFEDYTYVDNAIRREKELKGWSRTKKNQLIEEENDKFVHGMIDPNPFNTLLEIYDNDPALQNSFPKVKEGNYKDLFNWAQKNGINTYTELKIHQSTIDLLNIYYSNNELREKFPEVEKQHDLSQLLEWAINDGSSQYPSLKNHVPSLEHYYNKSF